MLSNVTCEQPSPTPQPQLDHMREKHWGVMSEQQDSRNDLLIIESLHSLQLDTHLYFSLAKLLKEHHKPKEQDKEEHFQITNDSSSKLEKEDKSIGAIVPANKC